MESGEQTFLRGFLGRIDDANLSIRENGAAGHVCKLRAITPVVLRVHQTLSGR